MIANLHILFEAPAIGCARRRSRGAGPSSGMACGQAMAGFSAERVPGGKPAIQAGFERPGRPLPETRQRRPEREGEEKTASEVLILSSECRTTQNSSLRTTRTYQRYVMRRNPVCDV